MIIKVSTILRIGTFDFEYTPRPHCTKLLLARYQSDSTNKRKRFPKKYWAFKEKRNVWANEKQQNETVAEVY